MKTIKFNYKVESFQNPYEGITSFQHFRGEKLYSDCVIGHDGIAGCETESYECYPVTEGVPENGREEGYYPDNSVVYIRILWKEFEPVRGKYNYDFIQKILDDAKAHNQSLMFRIMPHSTCERDDVPEWLKSIVECPKRPDGMRVKDSPTDPKYLEIFGEAIVAFAKRFDADPTLDIMDICLPGSWGEGHNLELYKKEDLIKFVDCYLKNFKHTHLIGQMGLPWLLDYENKYQPCGWRGDGTGSPKHMEEIFPNRISLIDDNIWKYAPVSFESYWWLGEWKRHNWDVDYIIQKTLEWHITNFNPKSLPIPYEWKDKIDAWVNKMGYHFVIDEVNFEEQAKDVLDLNLRIDNVGVAPIYNKIPLVIKLRNNGFEKEFITDVDIRKWLPGKAYEYIRLDIKDIPKGEYEVLIGIRNNQGIKICFATDAKQEDGYSVIDTVEKI